MQSTHCALEAIQHDVVDLGDGQYRAVLEVSGVSFGLQSDDQRESLTAAYAAFLNGLAFPIQILVRAAPVDVESHAARLERRAAHETGGPGEVLPLLAREHAVFLRHLARQRSLLERRFYVVIPAEPHRAARGERGDGGVESDARGFARAPGLWSDAWWRGPWSGRRTGAPRTTEATCEVAPVAEQLAFRCDEVARQLERCGLVARRLTTDELVRLYYACWCPERSRVQRLRARISEYAACAVRGTRGASRDQNDQAGAGGAHIDAGVPTSAVFSPNGQHDAPHAPPTDDERLFAAGIRSVVDLIAPSSVEVAPDHLRLERQYARTLAVTGYPRTVGAGWLAPLINFEEPIELSLHVHPLETGPMVRSLSHRLVQLESSRLVAARAGRLPDPEREVACQDIEGLRDALQRGDERVFSVGLYLLLRAPSRAALDDLTRRVEILLDGMLAQSRVATFEQDAGFHTCLPEGRDRLRVYRNLDTSSLATTFPFCSASLTMNDGALLGIARHNHSPVIVDPFDASLENANATVVATSGAGKSYFTKVLALRTLLRGVDFLVIDPEDEYRALCDAVGGQYVRLASTSAQHLNPFDLPDATPRPTSPPPSPESPATCDAVDDEGRDPLSEHVTALLGLLEIMLVSPGPSGSSGAHAAALTVHERATLDRALYETYEAFGITRDPATHARPSPLLRDLHAVLEAMPGDVAASCAARLRRYVEGSLAGLFAAPTDVALDNRLVVFNVQVLEPELRPLAIHTITSFVWGQVRRRRRPRLLVVDEAWSVLQYPEGGAFLAGLARRARKYWLGLLTISQGIGDFLATDAGRTVLANAATKLLLKQDPAGIDAVVETFRLTHDERQFLLAAAKGEGLLFCRGGRIAIKVEASAAEHRLATTTPAERAEAFAARPPSSGDQPGPADVRAERVPAAAGGRAGPRRRLGGEGGEIWPR